ncbi:hypothetical protein JWG45_01960 [Leptospira sp. 201903070]|uniref:Uncharacterized protein n=1 Tax=Leptospira ainlahdjerensis TaxID=2810033 RepID=A0ABS2U7G7_9LEPT|nr:hypothetical protein [Leptospira ainlahdjerensis]MBM9575908.1 hypothetical protein [Leptospira ainlahdjerensis]
MKFREILLKSKTSWKEFYSSSQITSGKEIQISKTSLSRMDVSPLPFGENLLTEQQLLYISEYYLALR